MRTTMGTVEKECRVRNQELADEDSAGELQLEQAKMDCAILLPSLSPTFRELV